MKRLVFVVLGLLVVAGCAGTKKRFTVIAEPPDAEIAVRIAKDEEPDTYRSPAEISLRIPSEGKRRYSAYVEITRDRYKPKKFFLNEIKEGDVLKVNLEKIARFKLSYRMISPVASDELAFQDKILSVGFTVKEDAVAMALTNRTGHPLRILWDRSEFTDLFNRQRRLMHSGVRYEDRNNIIPQQVVPPNGSLQQDVMTVDSVVYSREKKAWERKPLLIFDNVPADQLKGRSVTLFLPIEVNRQIIPYQFKFEVVEAVEE